MRTGISFTVSPIDRERLSALARDRNAPQKHVWRAKIVLLSGDGVGTVEIMRQTAKSKTCVWRWQERFAAEGFEGLLRDKTRPSRIPPLGPDIMQRVVALTLADPPGETTHWTADMMAVSMGISAVDPPVHAIVLSVDEKSQIQALDRTQPGLPIKKGRLGTMTHDYKRHGTTTLFAALNVLNGTVIGRNMQRHRHQEFIRFLNAVDGELPADKAVHVVLDNYAAHKHLKLRA
jgi:hypothetical protein